MIDGLISNAGICTKHNMEKMFVGLDTNVEPTCVKCVADATPKLGRLQTANDPGERFFNKNAVAAEPVQTIGTAPRVETVMTLSASVGFEETVRVAINALNSLPMPKDIKQFKAIQKAIKTLENLVEKSNG